MKKMGKTWERREKLPFNRHSIFMNPLYGTSGCRLERVRCRRWLPSIIRRFILDINVAPLSGIIDGVERKAT